MDQDTAAAIAGILPALAWMRLAFYLVGLIVALAGIVVSGKLSYFDRRITKIEERQSRAVPCVSRDELEKMRAAVELHGRQLAGIEASNQALRGAMETVADDVRSLGEALHKWAQKGS